MMVRVLYILSACAILAGCCVFAARPRLRCGADVQRDWIRDLPSAVQLYNERVAEQGRAAKERPPPLVAQAQALASCLAPPSRATTARSERSSSITQETAVTPSPRVVSVEIWGHLTHFRNLGTPYSFYGRDR